MEYTVVRVKKLVDGKAVGKSFRAYRLDSYGEVIYLHYTPVAKLEDDDLEFEVTESYDRNPTTPRWEVEGFKRKSSKCPRMEPSTEKGKLKRKRKALIAEKKTIQAIRPRTPDQEKLIKDLIVQANIVKAEMRALSIKRGQPVHNTIIVRGRGGTKHTKRKLLKVNVTSCQVRLTKEETV